MGGEVCAVCGKPLAARAGRVGRGSVSCSGACRQKAYRVRRGGFESFGVQGLIDDIGRRAGQLVSRPPGELCSGVTERAAARRMAERGSGVILTLNSGSAHGSPMTGGTGPADAALDTLVRDLAIELGPRGVRAVGI